MANPTAGLVGATLPQASRRLHRALLDGLLATGAVQPGEDLARAAEVDPAILPDLVAELVAADYVATDDTGAPVCLYPLSAVPTSHVVVVDGERRHAMCAIDALGIPAMLGRALPIQTSPRHPGKGRVRSLADQT